MSGSTRFIAATAFGAACLLQAPLQAQAQSQAQAQATATAAAKPDGPRTELRRADLSGAPGMEVVTSLVEYKQGDTLPLHFHHGVETGYVLQGAMVQLPGRAPNMVATGSPILNLRDVRHGGYKVVDGTLRLLTVHVVDKGKPLYDTTPE